MAFTYESDCRMTEITDTSAFEAKSHGKQVLFSVLTLGLYTLYWWHATHKQLSAGTDADFSPAMRTIGLFVPFYNFLVIWQTSNDAAAVTDSDGVVLFLLFLVFAPAAWFLIQSGMNGAAE